MQERMKHSLMHAGFFGAAIAMVACGGGAKKTAKPTNSKEIQVEAKAKTTEDYLQDRRKAAQAIVAPDSDCWPMKKNHCVPSTQTTHARLACLVAGPSLAPAR
jgi:hypothetical protein